MRKTLRKDNRLLKMAQISYNLLKINERINNAAVRAGRNPDSVRLVTVSKSVGPECVREAFNCGQIEFAENRVQKLMKKQEALSDINDNLKWHLIGQLQTNKIKYCAGKVVLIHSIDRIKLAEELGKYAVKNNIIIHGLIEINGGDEESKTGMDVRDVDAFLEAMQNVKGLEIEGLMTMAPLGADESLLHKIFSETRTLSERIAAMKLDNVRMNELSMGMSGDFEAAVEEGATICRIGTACFA